MTAEELHRVIKATESRSSMIQGFFAGAANPPVHYVRDTALPHDQQRVWATLGPIEYKKGHAAMMDEVAIRKLQIALDYAMTLQSLHDAEIPGSISWLPDSAWLVTMGAPERDRAVVASEEEAMEWLRTKAREIYGLGELRSRATRVLELLANGRSRDAKIDIIESALLAERERCAREPSPQ